jgi:4-amino-4-deoxy-L-arabinose transferase-like glycosyltransferase
MNQIASLPRISRAAFMIAALAFLVRLAFVSVHERPLFSDEVDYDHLGSTIAATGAYSDEGRPTAYRPIGYPALIAGVYAVMGHHPWVVHVAQAALGGVSAILLWLLAGGGRAGLWASGVWALYPSSILYADLLLPETVFTALLLAGALLAARGAFGSRRLSFLLGATVGALALLKPMALLLLLGLPLAARVERIRPTHFVLLALGTLLVIGPWLFRNWIVIGYPTPATSVGANLLIGNNPYATGGYSERVPLYMIPRDEAEGERDAGEIANALGYIANEPFQFVRNGLGKMAHLFGSEGGMIVWGFHRSPGDPSAPLRQKYRSLPLWLHAVVSGPYVLAILIGTLGLFAYPRGPTRAYFFAILGASLATYFVFYGGGRYHFPLMPFFVLFAADVLAGRRTLGPSRPGWKTYVAIAVIWEGLLGVWISELVLVMRP